MGREGMERKYNKKSKITYKLVNEKLPFSLMYKESAVLLAYEGRREVGLEYSLVEGDRGVVR